MLFHENRFFFFEEFAVVLRVALIRDRNWKLTESTNRSFGQKGEEENDAGVGIEEERGEVFVGQVE